MQKQKTLKRTLIIYFSAILGTVFFLALFIMFSIGIVKNAKETIVQENTHAEKLYQAEVAHYKWRTNLSASITFDKAFTGALDPKSCGFGKYIYGDEILHDEQTDTFIKQAEPIHNQIHADAAVIQDFLKANNQKAATEVYMQQVDPNVDKLVSIFDDTIAQRQNIIQDATDKFNGTLLIAFVVCSIIILLILALCISLYRFLKKEVIGNLDKLSNEVKRLANGELNLDLDLDCKTKALQNIRDALKNSIKEISNYIQAIDYGMEQFSEGNFACDCPITFLGDFAHIQYSIENFQKRMNSTLTELDIAAEQVQVGSHQVSDGAKNLADTSTEQASSIEELNATLEEISRQISSSAEHSRNANELGIQVGKVVVSSQAEMKHMVEAISDIAAASQDIHKIIKAIDDIAFQTNILALNAAVEAARAGSAGKGFAVVADEVRNLAQKSADAAQSTTELIENSLTHIHRGTELATRTDAAFDQVAEHSKNILDMVAKIAEASKEQEAAIHQFSIGIDQISGAVQMNSATSEENAASSDTLNNEALHMKQLIAQFSLKR